MPADGLLPKPLALCLTESLRQVYHGSISNYMYQHLVGLQLFKKVSFAQVLIKNFD